MSIADTTQADTKADVHFSPCVEKKLRKLLDEGYDRDQALAIAHKHCGESTEDSATGDLVGVLQEIAKDYRAKPGPEGTMVVEDVPIFGENQREFFGEKLVYDRGWLKQALHRDLELRSQGYRAPMHFGHHDIGQTRERAGHFELTHVRLCLYDGVPTWIVFGTLVFKSQAKLEKAISEFPYRSVEISGEKPNEINSLALLSSEAPYFRFPNLERVNFATLQDGTRIFAWRHPLMAQSPPQNQPDPKAAAQGAPAAAAAPPTMEPSVKAKPEIDAQGPTFDFAGFAKSAMDKIDSLLAFVAKMMEMQQGSTKPMMDEAKAKPEKPAEDGARQVPVVAASAELEGKVTGLLTQVMRLQAELDGERAFARLYAKLKPYGIANLETELRSRLAKSVEAAEQYSAGISAVATPRFTSEQPPESATVDPPEVAKYANRGELVLAQARRLYAMWASAGPKHFVREMKPETFIARNLVIEER